MTEKRTGAAGRREGTTYRRSTGLALVVSAGAIGLAGCGGSTSPPVANLATTTPRGASGTSASSGAPGSGSGSSASTVAGGDPTRLLVEWAACMRRHGDPNQVDPSIDTHKVIHIPWNPAIPGGYNGTNKGGQGNNGPGQYCRTYLARARSALLAGQARKPPAPGQVLKYAECMRANGIPDFPDPTASGLQLNHGGDLNPDNPTFQNASKLCARKTGAPAFGVGPPPPGTIQLTNP